MYRPRFSINEILRDKRFEPGEMIKKKNLTLINLVFAMVQLYIDFQNLLQHAKQTYRQLIGGSPYFEVVVQFESCASHDSVTMSR